MNRSRPCAGPGLWAAWADTGRALQLWSQILGKIRLAKTPWLNHSWHVTLYVTARGLTTGLIPFGARALELELDLVEHSLHVAHRRPDGLDLTRSRGRCRSPQFYTRLMDTLHAAKPLGTPVAIGLIRSPAKWPTPRPSLTMSRATPAPHDLEQAGLRASGAALLQADRVLKLFRTGFLGKASPVHLFWGGFDLAVTRFSGRRAPPHPGGIPNMSDTVTREAYSHEVSSCGFWLGGPGLKQAAFYAYAYPEPPGFREGAAVAPAQARYDTDFGEYILPYEAVRDGGRSGRRPLLAFLTSTYEAAANAARLGPRRARMRPGPAGPAAAGEPSKDERGANRPPPRGYPRRTARSGGRSRARAAWAIISARVTSPLSAHSSRIGRRNR